MQAGAGLISIGSIVDSYTLSNSSQYQSPSISSNSESSSVSDGSNSLENTENSDNNLETNSNGSIDSHNNNNNTGNENSKSNTNPLSSTSTSTSNSNSASKMDVEYPAISGSTILAIMRSKDSGVISADYIKSQTTINGNSTNEIQNSKSFSTDVEEMIRGSISGGYDEQQISLLLNSYGLKLSDYERQSNLAELEVPYLLLIEVPRENVPFVINNMEDIILTIPTNDAPDWMVDELKDTYSKNTS